MIVMTVLFSSICKHACRNAMFVFQKRGLVTRIKGLSSLQEMPAIPYILISNLAKIRISITFESEIIPKMLPCYGAAF